jgi:hypothetical protein
MTDDANGVIRSCTFENCLEVVINTACQECGLAYCLEHASEVDPSHFCATCLVPADASVDVQPLVDTEGVTHQGRKIIPVGKAYRLSSKMVFEMTDDELKDFIEHERSVVLDIERIRDYHAITLGTAESEAYRRNIGILAKVGGVLRVGTSVQALPRKHQAQTKQTKARSASKTDKVVSMLGSLGMTPQQLADLIRALPTKKEKEKK